MNENALRRLKGLQADRKQEDFPHSTEHYLAWAQEVLSLLMYSSIEFKRGFERNLEILADEDQPRKEREKAMDQCHALLDQGISFLENKLKHIAPSPSPLRRAVVEKVKTEPPKLPEKVTFGWAVHNFPIEWWLYGATVLVSVFLAGVYVGQTKLYRDFITPAPVIDAASAALAPKP